jgi:hypothetical protein
LNGRPDYQKEINCEEGKVNQKDSWGHAAYAYGSGKAMQDRVGGYGYKKSYDSPQDLKADDLSAYRIYQWEAFVFIPYEQWQNDIASRNYKGNQTG